MLSSANQANQGRGPEMKSKNPYRPAIPGGAADSTLC
jgi:hypothetical protein